MGWHVLSSTKFDFEEFDRASRNDESPRHLLPELARQLGTDVRQPDPRSKSALWARLASKIVGNPEHWELSKRLLADLKDGDTVYAAGCDSGLPVAVLSVVFRRSAGCCIAVSDATRLRTRWLLRFLCRFHPKLFLAVTSDHQAEVAQRLVGDRATIYVVEGQTDCRFFRPAEHQIENTPPLAASCGAEQRDYVTLDAALGDQEIMVRVCFASPNLSAQTRYTMPETSASNVSFEPLSFYELRHLYQQADVVVVPLLDNEYSAGLTALFEAMACGTPVVVTRTPGIIEVLIEQGHAAGVSAGDVVGLRESVQAVLANPAAAARRAQQARQVIVERYSSEVYLERLLSALWQFEAESCPTAQPSVDSLGS